MIVDDDREAAAEQRTVQAILAIAIGVIATGVVIGRSELDLPAIALLGSALIAIVGVIWRQRAAVPVARTRKR